MTRDTFNQALHELQDQVLALSSMAKESINAAVNALGRRDVEAARRLVDADQEINERRFALEANTLATIATQQPMAGDLRVLAAILEIATELERIADYGKGIARITLMMKGQPLVKPLVDIPQMAERAGRMLDQALDAFVRRDAALARSIPALDDEVDALYNQVYHDLIALIVADRSVTDRATHLLWVAHDLERAADRVTNICERVIFMVTGEMIEFAAQEA